MPLLSAIDDFVQRSLAALPTVWEKLRFVSGLREDDGNFHHWGLQQKYGDMATEAALTEVHAELCDELASTRLAELWLSADQAAHREQVDVAEFLKGLNTVSTRPEDLQGVAPEHLAYVVTNLSRVARYRSTSSHLAA